MSAIVGTGACEGRAATQKMQINCPLCCSVPAARAQTSQGVGPLVARPSGCTANRIWVLGLLLLGEEASSMPSVAGFIAAALVETLLAVRLRVWGRSWIDPRGSRSRKKSRRPLSWFALVVVGEFGI